MHKSLYLAVGLGSALGGILRLWLAGLVTQRWGDGFPWGTLLVNVIGSFAIGVFSGALGPGRWMLGEPAMVFLTAGICGGFTTFSAFSIQTLRLLQQGQFGAALANIASSVSLCLLAVWLGFWVGKAMSR